VVVGTLLDAIEPWESKSATDDFQAAGMASILFHKLKGGASVVLNWKPIGNS
jgi:hypothetical protein